MKAIVLAGGRGTRLRPLTHTNNKHLLPIGNEPMIYRVIKDVIKAGVKDIIVNINAGDTSIRKSLEKVKWSANFHYIEQKEANGMMYPIILAEKLIAGDDFILHAGDNVIHGGLNKYFKEFKRDKPDALVLVARVERPERFSVYSVAGKTAVKVVEKPKKYVGDLAGTAIYLYHGKAIFKAMKNAKPIKPDSGGKAEYFPPAAHQWMIDNGFKVQVTEVTGWWKDTGKPNDLILANRLVLEKKEKYKRYGKVENSEIEGEVEIKAGAVIKNCKIRGPVSIGADTIVNDSYIGPFTAVGDNCQVRNAQIENSILMGNVAVDNVRNRLDSCLLGWNSSVTQSDSLPVSTSLFIGDDSQVDL